MTFVKSLAFGWCSINFSFIWHTFSLMPFSSMCQSLNACRSISHHISLMSKKPTLKNKNYYTRYCFPIVQIVREYWCASTIYYACILKGPKRQLEWVVKCRITDYRIKVIDGLDWLTFKTRMARTIKWNYIRGVKEL